MLRLDTRVQVPLAIGLRLLLITPLLRTTVSLIAGLGACGAPRRCAGARGAQNRNCAACN